MELATDADSCIYSTDLDACATCSGEQDGSGVIVDNDLDDDGYCNLGYFTIFGCTQDWADNYLEEALNDGSFLREGCMSDLADNYDTLATIDDGSCFKEGCLDSTACNYDPFKFR